MGAVIKGVVSSDVTISACIFPAEITMTGDISAANISVYDGEYNIVPKPHEKQTLPTANKTMKNDVTVFEIPYYEVSNPLGTTIYIGKEIEVNG